MQFYLVSALVFALIVAVFAVQNTEIVIIKFLGLQSNVSLVLVILGSAVVGALVTVFLSLFRQFKSWKSLKQLKSRNAELENDLKKLNESLLVAEQKLSEEKIEEVIPQN